MMDRADLLTYPDLRALATCEAVVTETAVVAIAAPDPARPVLKDRSDRSWLQRLVRVTPQAGDIVFARSAWRVPHRASLLEQLQVPVVLLSAFYDPPIKDVAAQETLESPIAHWFGIQVGTTHPKLTGMPIGIEPHMIPIIQATERRAERDILLYLNFRCAHRYPPLDAMRAGLYYRFKERPWVTADPWMATGEARYVQQLGRSQFVLSPRGYGFDCYRTYEAIAMGAIPIVKRHPPQTDVCAGMGVLFVNSWNEITEDRLRTEWARRQALGTDFQRLTLRYWAQRIRATARCAGAPLQEIA